jgi:hypothetical protein
MIDEWENVVKESVVACSRNCPTICLEGVKGTTKEEGVVVDIRI